MNKKYNLAISPTLQMNFPNEKLKIYTGEFMLKTPTSEINAVGEIYFKWFPHPSAEFLADIDNFKESKLLFDSEEIQFLIDRQLIGKCYISSQTISEKCTIKGAFYDKPIIGDKSLTSKKFKFSVLNFEDYLGEAIEYPGGKYSRARINIKNDKFEILIDKIFDFKSQFDQLKEDGGYQILYNGEINILKGSYNYEQTHELLNILGHFLSFISGKKNNPLFLTAMHEDEIIYQEFTGYSNHLYEYRPSMFSNYTTSYINNLFSNFYELWKSGKDNKFFLEYIIHWYTEINCNSGYSEGSLIMAQTAIELLYNWLIVEQKKIIIGKDSENISAASKMRLLISQLSISTEIPSKFKKLEEFRINTKSIDALETIVQIRNAIVHSQEEKRKKLSEIHTMVIYEAVQLSLWYIEMALLHILKFEDKYVNRCSDDLRVSNKLELPPWIN